MKTHTQQQTNLEIEIEIEIIATEPKLSRQKRSEYRPRKWRGNTLVPVIIALAISAIATVAFLNQGADLTEKNKVILAQNEIASALSDWVVSREATGGANAATTAAVPTGRNAITFGSLTAAIPNTTQPYNTVIANGTRYLTFTANSANNCNILDDRFTRNTIDGVGSAFCIDTANPANATATGDILVIMLD